MAESHRKKELTAIFGRKFDTIPLTKRRRTDPQVNGHIEDDPRCTAHQFRHGCRHVLIVQPPKDSLLRTRVVILDELLVNAESRVSTPVIGLEEETPAISVNLRLDYNYTGKRR